MTPAHARRQIAVAAALVAAFACGAAPERDSWLSAPQTLAPGVEFFRTVDSSLVEHAGPIAVFLLRLDPARVRLTSVLSNDQVADAETVQSIAARHRALAAINGGFFNSVNGEPIGVLKVSGELVSDASVSKGAVIVSSRPGVPVTLTFDRLSAKMNLVFTAGGQPWIVPVDGVDTTRERGRLMVYTPAYHEDTDTAPTGTEWVIDGDPPQVVSVRANAGHTAIPQSGVVLSYGGTALPAPLAALTMGTTVRLETQWRSTGNLPSEVFERADHVINGAGLLRWKGTVVTDWSPEGLRPDAFTDVRHPRTVIGQDDRGAIWLVAIDGRQPDYSIGMRFADLQRLADRLHLTDALNLDGGGSTTMVINGVVVNKPSDAGGARAVGDAILVSPQ